MTKRKTRGVKISVQDARAAGQEFVEAWKRSSRGEAPLQPIERVYFTKVETLLKTLTNRRVELLHALRRHGPISVRALAQQLRRDYKNVHTDVKALVQIGLVESNEDGRFYVPWDRISTEIDLAA